MIGSGDFFEAKGKKYTILPIAGAHIEQLMADNLNIGENQMFNLYNEESKNKLNKWLGGEEVVAIILDKKISVRYCYDNKNDPMSLEQAFADGWDVVDFKRYVRKLCDLSG